MPKEPIKQRPPTTPQDFPVPAPNPPLPSGDFTYTLEAVVSINAQLGRLTEAVESLKAGTKDHNQELKDIAKDVHAAKVVLKVAAGVITLVVAIAGAVGIPLLSKLVDLLTEIVKKSH